MSSPAQLEPYNAQQSLSSSPSGSPTPNGASVLGSISSLGMLSSTKGGDACPNSSNAGSPRSSSSSSSSQQLNNAVVSSSQQIPQSMGSISAAELLGVSGGNNDTVNSNRGKIEVKLFIGRLPRTIEDITLTPMFSPFGEVVETVIIRDKMTGMHKGSAFIKMASITEADAAVRALHNIKVVDPQLGPIQVKYANGEPERLGLSLDSAQAGSDLGKLFVGSLQRGVTESEVRHIFDIYGKIEEVVLMKDPSTNQSRGCAFVKFTFKEDAIHAIKGLHGIYTCQGCSRPLEVKFAENRRALTTQLANNITNIQPTPASTTSYHSRHQQQHHHHHSGILSNNNNNNSSLSNSQPSNLNPRSSAGWTEYFTADGRAYYHNETTNMTQWTKPIDFDRLYIPLPHSTISGGNGGGSMNSNLALGTSHPGTVSGSSDVAGPPGANVFVFHIPNEWTQNEVISHFSHFGHVISCYIATDRATGRNKGYGFVSFDNIQSSANAVLGMNGYLVGSKRLKVSIKTGEEGYVAHLLNGNHNQGPNSGGGGGGGPIMNSNQGYHPMNTSLGGYNVGNSGGLGSYRSSPY